VLYLTGGIAAAGWGRLVSCCGSVGWSVSVADERKSHHRQVSSPGQLGRHCRLANSWTVAGDAAPPSHLACRLAVPAPRQESKLIWLGALQVAAKEQLQCRWQEGEKRHVA
jgi:hypothetical protein